jgi:hypothetical protein
LQNISTDPKSILRYLIFEIYSTFQALPGALIPCVNCEIYFTSCRHRYREIRRFRRLLLEQERFAIDHSFGLGSLPGLESS